ncbi:MAG TPA: efflux RND transporter periplasmic adaptor subunit [Thermomonas sp.]|nr:efflux RND transporter periplasmic adaptor subunit [Thermomonas sp.]
MKVMSGKLRSLLLAGVLVALVGVFAWVVARSGPMALVPVTVAKVESRAVAPALFGIGTVEARYTHRIGPTAPGRLEALLVEVGDQVRAGQVLGRMAPVDLDDRSRAAFAAQQQALAMLAEARAREAYAASQLRRYEALARDRYVSAESVSARRQEAQVAGAAVRAAGQAVQQARAEGAVVSSQQANLALVAPVDGVVSVRSIDPGTTVVAGQAVVEVIDPRELWVHARFDQGSASGLAPGLPARIVLRSRSGVALDGKVLRVEPKADAVTEETLAKLVFSRAPQPLPPLGELAEATVVLPPAAPAPTIPNAALHRVEGEVGVWKFADGGITFAPVVVGASDLDGRVHVVRGLQAGDEVVVYSEKPLTPRSRIKVVEALAGARR